MMQAVYLRDQIPNSFKVPQRVLGDIMAHFASGIEEITFSARCRLIQAVATLVP